MKEDAILLLRNLSESIKTTLYDFFNKNIILSKSLNVSQLGAIKPDRKLRVRGKAGYTKIPLHEDFNYISG